MLKLARMGVVILPPVPAFYNNPQNLDDMINHSAIYASRLIGSVVVPALGAFHRMG
jgi:3-polyprenyl-4-hydroxybenzoate decarboxylase